MCEPGVLADNNQDTSRSSRRKKAKHISVLALGSCLHIPCRNWLLRSACPHIEEGRNLSTFAAVIQQNHPPAAQAICGKSVLVIRELETAQPQIPAGCLGCSSDTKHQAETGLYVPLSVRRDAQPTHPHNRQTAPGLPPLHRSSWL